MITSKCSLGGSHYYDVLFKCHYGFHCGGSVLIGFVLVAFIMGFSQPLFKRQQENLANINGYIEEIYTGQAVVTSYNAAQESSQAKAGDNSINRCSTQFISLYYDATL